MVNKVWFGVNTRKVGFNIITKVWMGAYREGRWVLA